VSALPSLRQLVPHAPPMLLLDELLEWTPGRARCAVRLRPDSPFMEDGRVRALVSLEYMAQAAAACAGADARGGEGNARGLLLGTRELTLAVEHFQAGDELVVEAERASADEQVTSFRCQVRRGEALVARAVLSVFHPAAGRGTSP
jgi:predicted hotdog family 3-hydroxylacyl-ACP dehydratase